MIGNVVLGSCSSWTGRGPSCCDGAVERHLILPRAVFADGFGTANGQAVEEYFLLWDGERRGLVFRNARSALPKPNDKQKNRQSKSNEFFWTPLLMRSVCILNSDAVNERNGEVEKSKDEGIEKDQS